MWPLASFGTTIRTLPVSLFFERRCKRSLGDRLARVSIQGGLGIEALQMAGAADHEQPDDILGPGREMGLPVRRLPVRRCSAPLARAKPSRCEHRTQGHAAESHPQLGEKRTSRDHVIIGS